MKIIPFNSDHIRAIDTQEAQLADDACTDNNSEEYSKWLANQGKAITGLDNNGVVLFCAGQVTIWDGRHMVWASLSKSAAKHMVSITKAIKRAILCSELPGRTEMIIRADFHEGCRWARILGFQFHHYEEKFLPDGRDARVYVRFS